MFQINDDFNQYTHQQYNVYLENISKSCNKNIKDYFKNKNLLFFATNYGDNKDIIIQEIINASLLKSKQTYFGTFLESLAQFIIEKYRNGEKSTQPGIDMEFELEEEKDGKDVYIYLSIKSSSKWSNANALKGLKKNCKDINENHQYNYEEDYPAMFIDGCCTGETQIQGKSKDEVPLIKLCGKEFWEFLTDDPDFYYKLLKHIPSIIDQYEVNNLQMEKCLKQELQTYLDKQGNIDYSLIARKMNYDDRELDLYNLIDNFY